MLVQITVKQVVLVEVEDISMAQLKADDVLIAEYAQMGEVESQTYSVKKAE